MINQNSPYLTASEQVYLQGEKFAEKGGLLNKYKLMHIDEQVALSDLVTKVVAAAFLASEKAGAVRLEVRKKKALLGLASVKTIYAEPLTGSDFPPGSLEAKLSDLAAHYQLMKGKNEIWMLVYAWLRMDVASPWASAAELIQAGLGERLLVDVITEKKLKIFTSTRYELPESTRLLATAAPLQPVQQLFTDCRGNRPEVWELLVKQIKQGVEKRKEVDTSD